MSAGRSPDGTTITSPASSPAKKFIRFPCLAVLYYWPSFPGLIAMAGVPAGLPDGVRISDHISLGVIAKTVPLDRIQQILAGTGKASERERDLPAQAMIYYAIAMALYMGSGTRGVLRCLLEGLRWPWGADAVEAAGKSGIPQARSRLGETPLRRLYRQGRAAGGGARQQGRVVSDMAAGELGRVLPGCGRHGRERHRFRLSGRQPRRERLPADPLRGLGGEWHAHAVRRPAGQHRGGRGDAGP